MVLLGFVGDVLIDRDDPASVFANVEGVIAELDVLFGNCESPYTTEPHCAPSAPVPLSSHPTNTKALSIFDVMSLANNHIVDCGHDAMLETVELVRAAGAQPVGVGRNLAEARNPAIVDSAGLRIGYLAYSSVFPHGYEAGKGRPGLAPVRAYNHHVEAIPNYWEPGVTNRVVTFPDERDYARLAEDLSAAREEADVVVASFHWGDYRRPFVLTDHERRTARFAIDHGADVIVGHHHHILRGIEWYNGKPIFYGLGHFVFDLRAPVQFQKRFADLRADDAYELYPREGWPLLPMHPDARLTMLGWVDLAPAGTPTAVGFLPCDLAPDGAVHARHPESPEGRKVVAYMRQACDSQRLGTELTLDMGHQLDGFPTIRATDVVQ